MLEKHTRLDIIREVVKSEIITTQEELKERLAMRGIEATQATLSRNVKQLGIEKRRGSDGILKYRLPESGVSALDDSVGIFAASVQSAQAVGNMVCVHCSTGFAQGVCAVLDSLTWDGLVGTIAGDDTIFALCRNEEFAQGLAGRIQTLAAGVSGQ
ncbi:MAG: arginine repressor [Oscillospiraceae bacterium]|jgi:transcriptional regulator of arginine metabolism|nr:arginine repressor [Oscillospiraceae bacterium]